MPEEGLRLQMIWANAGQVRRSNSRAKPGGHRMRRRERDAVEPGLLDQPLPECPRHGIEGEALAVIEDVPAALPHFVLQLRNGPAAVPEENAEVVSAFRQFKSGLQTSFCHDGLDVAGHVYAFPRRFGRTH